MTSDDQGAVERAAETTRRYRVAVEAADVEGFCPRRCPTRSCIPRSRRAPTSRATTTCVR
jgi:hypothetical protein